MKSAFFIFLRQRSTIIGVSAALMIQVIFCFIWMTGYDGVLDRTDQFKLLVVNEDSALGSAIVSQLKDTLPFMTELAESQEQAMEQLSERQAHMIMHIPAQFFEQLRGQEPITIQYTVNESNPQIVSSVMEGATNRITKEMNTSAVHAGIQNVLSTLPVNPVPGMDLSEQLAERVVADIQVIHPVKSFSNQMIPLMLVIASYVGAMVMAMNLHQSAQSIAKQTTRWQRWTVWCLINTASAVLISLAGTSLMMALGGQVEQGFIAMWGFQSLFMMTFMFVAQLFVLLLGIAGMLLNVMMLSLQLVASGAILPRELLPQVYYHISQYLPATYAVEGNMNMLFGGAGQPNVIIKLFVIWISAAVLGGVIAALKRDKFAEYTLNDGLEMIK